MSEGSSDGIKDGEDIRFFSSMLSISLYLCSWWWMGVSSFLEELCRSCSILVNVGSSWIRGESNWNLWELLKEISEVVADDFVSKEEGFVRVKR